MLQADPVDDEVAVELTTAAGRRSRVARVDVLRAVAALAVLVGHAYALGGRALPIRAQRIYDVPLLATSTGVWLFFAISGYVISRPFVEGLIAGERLPALGPYALRRGARIFPLFWLALTAYLAIDGLQGTTAPQLVAHYLLVNNLVPGREEALLSVAWTLTLEMLFYAVLPLLALALVRSRALPRGREARSSRLAALVLVSWLASSLFTAGADLLGDGEIGLWLRGSLPAMWQMFCPGLLLAVLAHGDLGAAPADLAGAVKLSSALGRLREWLTTACAAALAAGLVIPAVVLSALAPLRFGVVPYQLIVDATRPLFALGYGIVVARAVLGRRAAPSRALLELGLASYGLYLIHPIVIDFLLTHPSLIPIRGAGLGATAVHVVLVLAITVPAAVLSWRAVERPAIALARRAGGRR